MGKSKNNELIIKKCETIQLTSMYISRNHILYLSVDWEKKGAIRLGNMETIMDNSKEVEEENLLDLLILTR